MIAKRIGGRGDVLEGVTKIPMDLCMESDRLGGSTTQSGDFEAHVHTNHYGPQIGDPPYRN